MPITDHVITKFTGVAGTVLMESAPETAGRARLDGGFTSTMCTSAGWKQTADRQEGVGVSL